MSNTYFIYLCGGMGKFGKEKFDECNKWRRYCKESLECCECNYNVKAVNPNDYFNFADDPPQYKTQDEVMRLDLHKLRNSNLVVVNFNDMYSLGSMAEISIAYDRGIPVIGLNEDNQNLHPWQECMCERVFNNVDKMLDYIEDFYLR
jgi:nucleoside 2-deoxyribosyltransferase